MKSLTTGQTNSCRKAKIIPDRKLFDNVTKKINIQFSFNFF